MSQLPSFASPVEAIRFIQDCALQNDAAGLYAAFMEQPSDFWKDRLISYLREIEDTETLQRVFLEDGCITAFPEHEPVLYLGGHDPRTQYLHIKLIKTDTGWVLESIQVCR